MAVVSRQALWPGEVRDILAACRNVRASLVVRALLETGLRACELAFLRASDVDVAQRKLRLPFSGAAQPISEELAAAFQEHFRDAQELGLGTRQLQRIVHVVASRAGLENVTPDVLRRTASERASSQPHATSPEMRRRLFESAADASPDLIFIVDDEAAILEANLTACKALALAREQIVGKSVEDFFDCRESADGSASVCTLRSDESSVFYGPVRTEFLPGLHLSILRRDEANASKTPGVAGQHSSAGAAMRYLLRSRSVHWLRAGADGVVLSQNSAFAEKLGPVEGRSVWEYVAEPDAVRLREELAAHSPGHIADRVLNFLALGDVPFTLECQVTLDADGFTLIGEPSLGPELALQQGLIDLNHRLIVLLREKERERKMPLGL